MTDKVQYSIIKTEEGTVSVQSTVKSFSLDHVTSKDISSFYANFSQYAAWDTGLLPVDGSGILSIRTAGEYVQFAYQHKPGLYHVNWSKTEGSPATAYYLAQPYRIIICDMYQGNLLGARTFYSPYPITNPSQQLYHVNLPNINCLGYRGNGVGWICLYQNENWSHLPLNERIIRFIERCSGVETYNDGNMNETDGPRFYQSNGKPSYVYNPIDWQEKSSEEGYEWTLDPGLWIPVLVESMDSQGHHDPNGIPLTFADAIVGDYRAYYYDEKPTKPINSIIRPDKELDSKEIMSYFIKSYNGATQVNNPLLNDTFNTSINVKNKIGSAEFTNSPLLSASDDHEEDNDNYITCSYCEESYEDDGTFGVDAEANTPICGNCIHDYYVHIQNGKGYYLTESTDIVYDEKNQSYYHLDYDHVLSCEFCGSIFGTSSKSMKDKKAVNNSIYLDKDENQFACINCLEEVLNDNSEFKDLEKFNCFSCQRLCVDHEDYSHNFPKIKVLNPVFNFESEKTDYIINEHILCQNCADNSKICPCGFFRSSEDSELNPCTYTEMVNDEGDVSKTYAVNKCCSTCLAPVTFDEEGQAVASFSPFQPEAHKVFISSIKNDKNHSSVLTGLHFYDGSEPF